MGFSNVAKYCTFWLWSLKHCSMAHRKAVIHEHIYELWMNMYALAQVHYSNFFPRARILNKCQGYWKKGGLDSKIQLLFFFFCEFIWCQDDIVFTKKNFVTASEAVCKQNWIFFQSFRFSHWVICRLSATYDLWF